MLRSSLLVMAEQGHSHCLQVLDSEQRALRPPDVSILSRITWFDPSICFFRILQLQILATMAVSVCLFSRCFPAYLPDLRQSLRLLVGRQQSTVFLSLVSPLYPPRSHDPLQHSRGSIATHASLSSTRRGQSGCEKMRQAHAARRFFDWPGEEPRPMIGIFGRRLEFYTHASLPSSCPRQLSRPAG